MTGQKRPVLPVVEHQNGFWEGWETGNATNRQRSTVNHQLTLKRRYPPASILWLLCLLMGLWACARAPGETGATATLAVVPTDAPAAVLPSTAPPRDLPTLYPTFTAIPSPTAPAAPTATPTRPTATPLPLDTTWVMLRYEIPALGLARTLRGTVGNQIVMTDELTGKSVTQQNQVGVLLEIEEALGGLVLAEMPASCPTCVHLTYELPLQARRETGWFTDPVFLGSVENYLAVALGPHFPPATRFGLRRRASAFKAAQTIAWLEDGVIWNWPATAADVPTPQPPTDAQQAAFADAAQLALRATYGHSCLNYADDFLYFAGTDDNRTIRVNCSAQALPTVLLPLYAQLEMLLAGQVDETAPPMPPLPLAPPVLLFYQRADAGTVTLFPDGTVEIGGISAEIMVKTLAADDVITLTAAISRTGVLMPTNAPVVPVTLPVVGKPFQFATENVIALRTDYGVISLGWNGTAVAALQGALRLWDRWLDDLLPVPLPTPTLSP